MLNKIIIHRNNWFVHPFLVFDLSSERRKTVQFILILIIALIFSTKGLKTVSYFGGIAQ
jgi:hypothetical protein